MIHTVEEAISRLPQIQLDSDFSPRNILHMILARGPAQTIYNLHRGYHQPAVEFLCQETHTIPGYPILGGIIKEDSKGRAYFSAGMEKTFQSNVYKNEFLGTLALAGVRLHSTAVTTNRQNEITLKDMADSAMETYKSDGSEPSWSLMLFAVHPGFGHEWHNASGELQSVERVLAEACKWRYGSGSCLGTHILESICFAVSRYCLQEDLEPHQLSGVWKEALEYIRGAVHLMRQNQRDDGSIKRCWFKSRVLPASTREWREKFIDVTARRMNPAKAIVYPTGHCLDAISSMGGFLGPDRMWVDQACFITAQTIQSGWVQLANEISAVTHAIHALKIIGE